LCVAHREYLIDTLIFVSSYSQNYTTLVEKGDRKEFLSAVQKVNEKKKKKKKKKLQKQVLTHDCCSLWAKV
jgi:hypothetical protein